MTTFTHFILPALLIMALAVLLMCAHFKIANLLYALQTEDVRNGANEKLLANQREYRRNLEIERDQIEIHLFGEIRHASAEAICMRINKLTERENKDAHFAQFYDKEATLPAHTVKDADPGAAMLAAGKAPMLQRRVY